MNSRVREGIENLVVFAIILVLIQTFLEDLAILLAWPWDVRRVLVFAGFGFDLFFTAEFLIRFFAALSRRRAAHYLLNERGWIDFLASIPLLLLNSGPAAFALMAGGVPILGFGGILNVLKVVKAIRIARILRLLRLLKIFRRIKNTDSTMAQRHVATITTLAVVVFVFSLLGFAFAETFLELPSLDTDRQERAFPIVDLIETRNLADPANRQELQDLMRVEQDVLQVRRGNELVYDRYEPAYYERFFGPGDYDYLVQGEVSVFFDLRPVAQDGARANLLHFLIIVLIVGIYLFYYSGHFALTVSDPITIMRRGMQEKGYNLEVLVPREYANDEVYRLAGLYNEVYLPLKDRTGIEEDSGVLDLKLDDVKDLLDDPDSDD